MKKKHDDPPPATSTPPPEASQASGAPSDAATTLRADRDRVEAQLQRAMADLSNVRKRHAKDVDDVRSRVVEGLAQELLPVLDGFGLALSAHEQQRASDGQGSLVDGLRMVKALLTSVLERHGMIEIQAEGAAFDPNRHEAVGLVPTFDQEPGRVAKVLQRGYAIGDKVIRPTRVLVTATPSDQAGAGETPNEGKT